MLLVFAQGGGPRLLSCGRTGDNGTLTFWDYGTGIPFQNLDDIPQPGSLEAEAGVFCSTFDHTGTRLITGGADKTIKVYAEQKS